MNDETIQNRLRDLLDELIDAHLEDDENDPVAELAVCTEGFRSVRTFADAHLLTSDKGLVVECDDGTEYQITIVRSR